MPSLLRSPALIPFLLLALAGLIYQAVHAVHAQNTPSLPASSQVTASELLSPQQFVYTGQTTLPGGERAGVFAPNHNIELAVQSRSGSPAMIVGDVVWCRPFVEMETLAGTTFRELRASRQMLSCAPLAKGEPDRILMVVALRWAK